MPRGPDKKPRKLRNTSEKQLRRRRNDLMVTLLRLEIEAHQVQLPITQKLLSAVSQAARHEINLTGIER